MQSLNTKTTKRSEPMDYPEHDVSAIVVDCAFKVHSNLGPGLLESTYERCLIHELNKKNLHVEAQKMIPIVYDGIRIDAGYRVDLMVEDSLIVEIKAVEKMSPVFQAQLMTYLRHAQKKTGLLINFNTKLIKDGIRRISI